MIELTSLEGNPVFISPENTAVITLKEGRTAIYTSDSGIPLFVSESQEEVTRKVLDYRLSLIQYPVYLSKAQETEDWTRTAQMRRKFLELAGLESEELEDDV